MIDAPPDAQEFTVDFESMEGGEVRLEYLQFPPGNVPQTRARGTAFFYKGPSVHYPLPVIPGCTTYQENPPTKWPLAQAANRQYLDVGQVIITGGPQQFNLAAGAVTTPPTKDFLDRAYTGPWRFSSLNDMGRTFISDNTRYDVVLTGSAEWPAQIFEDVLYMPDAFPLISPAASVSPVPLVANTPLTITYQVPTNTQLPAGSTVDTLIAFTNGNPPVVICTEEGIDGSITIPAATVDLIRAAVPGGSRILRQHVVHNLRELTNGITHQNQRIDFLSVWCYNYPFSVPAP
ncbi:MAG: hypothetical protein H0T42_32185 [Deltaproteobacteria bacterium]|nr:hypothetical protein [Deltaproteobacteria bacterium]